MAIRTLRSGIGEYGTGVALHAGDLLVHAEQGIPGLVVVEFGFAADWFPTCEGMTVVASDVQGSVRASRLLRALVRACLGRPGQAHHQRSHPRKEDRHVLGTRPFEMNRGHVTTEPTCNRLSNKLLKLLQS